MKYAAITKENFEEIIISQRQPTILIFGAKWSGNSEIMFNMMDRVSQEFESDFQLLNVDIEDQSDIANFFEVRSVPTTILIKEGKIVEFIKGFIPAHKIRKKIKLIYLHEEV